MNASPWLGYPYDGDREPIEALVPKGSYPKVGVINGLTGDLITEDGYDGLYDGNGIPTWMDIVDGK
tara:strand:+ start:513 stop:710 length:198 start_codon:yes stop_codon:yes gene_type:complete